LPRCLVSHAIFRSSPGSLPMSSQVTPFISIVWMRRNSVGVHASAVSKQFGSNLPHAKSAKDAKETGFCTRVKLSLNGASKLGMGSPALLLCRCGLGDLCVRFLLHPSGLASALAGKSRAAR